ncbi:MAG: TIGR03619 family F420-dependent LLM class oxidoreductase, partial [Hyphomicrobiales bacterium]|nr:TIGR03619 family F420-dependent LLM class oxidoreductase [Hyphomicrobiales bacterium]
MSLLFSVGFPTGMEGLTYPIPFSDPESLVQIAQRAEALGYHSVWGNDHMTTQNYVRAEFPVPPRFWEPLVTYSFLAAHTTKLRFGTGVLVLPMRRDIVVTAKQIATLDHLSNGRAEIGVGVGAYREEFEALWPDANRVHRGDMVEEGVQALQLLFSERVASFEGKYYRFKDVELYPKPKQKRLPIYFGGNNPAHLRRTAESADGWVPAGLPLETLRRMVGELKQMTEAAGRRFSDLQIAPQYVV